MASGRNAEYDAFRDKIGNISNAVAGHGLPGITAIANALFEHKLITENDHQAVISMHDTPIKVVTTMLNSLLTRIKYNPSTYSKVLEVFKNNELEYIANMLEATHLPAASPTLASPTLASPMLALAPVVNPGILYTMYLVQYQTCTIYYYFRTASEHYFLARYCFISHFFRYPMPTDLATSYFYSRHKCSYQEYNTCS